MTQRVAEAAESGNEQHHIESGKITEVDRLNMEAGGVGDKTKGI